jgi:hypothetical protein
LNRKGAKGAKTKEEEDLEKLPPNCVSFSALFAPSRLKETFALVF